MGIYHFSIKKFFHHFIYLIIIYLFIQLFYLFIYVFN